MTNETSVPTEQPKGAQLIVTPDGLVAKARVESPGWQSAATVVLFGAWTLAWGIVLAQSLVVKAESTEPVLVVFFAGATLFGAYCLAMSLWGLFGSETVRFQGKRMAVSNPWLFGFLNKSFRREHVQAFTFMHHDCDTEHTGSGCCSSLPKDEYRLTFAYGGKRIAVFTHASDEAKKWLCDQLNERLPKPEGDACASEEHSCSCKCH